MSPYLFGHDWAQERRRLALLEQIYDGGTRHLLSRLPLPADAHCLEVGAGAGSIALWLCDQVGEGGRVVGTDLDVEFLSERAAGTKLEVRRHDVVTEDLEKEAFDLVHARLVLEHIRERDDVLPRLVAALRPGGWLLLEDYDWVRPSSGPHCIGRDLLDRCHEAFAELLFAAGYRDDYGLALPGAMRALGLVDVDAEGRVHLGTSGSPESDWWRLTLAKICPLIIDSGALTEAELEKLFDLFDHEEFLFRLPTLMGVWGRRPG
ncbi:MAG TPA: methyltransferase [Acidimicrobiia bacterium]|nr:methyltransferase [Acidimicrobiia bacterium]